MIIKPIKNKKEIINPASCVGCTYRSVQSKKECKSCGNWNLDYKKTPPVWEKIKKK